MMHKNGIGRGVRASRANPSRWLPRAKERIPTALKGRPIRPLVFGERGEFECYFSALDDRTDSAAISEAGTLRRMGYMPYTEGLHAGGSAALAHRVHDP